MAGRGGERRENTKNRRKHKWEQLGKWSVVETYLLRWSNGGRSN